MIAQIKKAYPAFDIVSEEENYSKVPTDNCFIIDPIDGTINFANNLPLWAIQVAMKKNGKTVAAVVDMPRIREFYSADTTGAYLNGSKIHTAEVAIKNALYAIDGSNNLAILQNMSKHTSHSRNLGGVCVSMAFVAAGRIHGAVFRSDKPWDYAPGLFLVQQAGGKIMDVPGFHAAAMNDEFLQILKLEAAKKPGSTNVFVLHSLNGDTLQMWGQDVKAYLTQKGIDCFMPQFPIRGESSFESFDKVLSAYLDHGLLNKDSIVIAHSIGNPYFIRFCSEHGFMPKHYIAVAPKLIYRYPIKRTDYMVDVAKQAYLSPQALAYAKNIKSIYCLYSNEDDGNIECFERFIKDFKAKPMYLKGYNHFDGYHRIYKIPELLALLDELL